MSSCAKASDLVLYAAKGSLRGTCAQIVAQWSGKKLIVKTDGKEAESSNGIVLKGKEVELRDSCAIAFFLASAELKNSKDTFALSQVIQWMSYADNHVRTSVLAWLLPCLDSVSSKNSSTGSKAAKEELLRCLRGLNEVLLTRTYLIDERASLADLYVFGALLPLYEHVLDTKARAKFQNLTRWFLTILNQPETLVVVKDFKLCEKPAKGSTL